MNIWQFMATSPFLTFFIVLIIGIVIVKVVQYIAYVIRGDPTVLDDDDEDE